MDLAAQDYDAKLNMKCLVCGKMDNRPENLEIMTFQEHQLLHSKKKNEMRKRDRYGRFSA